MSKRFPTHPVPKSTFEQPHLVSKEQQHVIRPAKPKPKPKPNPALRKPELNSFPQDKAVSPVVSVDKSVRPLPIPEPSSKEQDSALVSSSISSLPSADNYNLGPVAPAPTVPSPSPTLEFLIELLYSPGYLDTLTSDPQLLPLFTNFLARYQPSIAPLVPQYLQLHKVAKAIAYANAVAAAIPNKGDENGREEAVILSAAFKARSEDIYHTLLTIALPAWISYSVIKTSTICLTAEITGHHASPFTRDLIRGLSEVFCLTDPNKPDNPIIYASSCFYTLFGYSKSNVIGRNCRFLQGAKTQRESVMRLRDAVKKGNEACETMLNYTRDGKPFLNTVLLAPLHDDKGNVKYYLGAQVDASRLVESRQGIDGFERFLSQREVEANKVEKGDHRELILDRLQSLSMCFDLQENAVVQDNSRRNLFTANVDANFTSRRRIQEEEPSDDEDESDGQDVKNDVAWKLSAEASTGQLPGIYKSYILVRPFPSLRMVFLSPGARKFGKLRQHPFLSHVAAPASTLSCLKDSFQTSTPVNAKIVLMQEPGKNKDGCITGKWGRKGESPAEKGETCVSIADPFVLIIMPRIFLNILLFRFARH